jgi:hypothetical protein
MAVSKQDIPCLQQIINVALCNGASVHQVVNKLEDALEAMMRATWILLCSCIGSVAISFSLH